MSRNDYISKLFIDNQDKLDERPSNDLWDRLEARLDEELPVETSSTNKGTSSEGTGGSIISMSRFLAAASIVLAVFSMVALYQFADQSNLDSGNTTSPAIAMNDVPNERHVSELSTEDLADSEENTKEEIFEQEDKLQEERILAEVRTLADVKEDEKVVLEDIEIVEEVTEPVDVITMAVEDDYNNVMTTDVTEPGTFTVTTGNSTTTGYAGGGAGDPTATNTTSAYKTPQNYANINTQISNSDNSNQVVDAIIEQQQASNLNTKQENIRNGTGTKDKLTSRRGSLKNRKKGKKSSNPMAMAHPRLYNFGWLLGKWVDNQEGEGESREEWKLKDANTIIGKGFKLKDGASIFQEKIIIEYRPEFRQVFLLMYVDDSKTMAEYMLTDPEPERLIFKQNDYSQLPDQVIIERGIDDYKIIINNNNSMLTPDQQRYLDNRNRVSSVRALRVLEYVED